MSLEALVIFLLTYLIIALPERFPRVPLDRPSGALLGAVLMVLAGVLSFEEAFAAIDFKTIVLLLGMMILVVYLTIAGFLELISVRILQIAKNPFQLLMLVVFSSGFLSALFVNDTICVVYTPILLRTVMLAKLNPLPYLIALATSSNIGSAATIVGNPQNMLIGTQSKIPFLQFFVTMLPVSFIGLLINIAVISFLYRKEIFHNGFAVALPEPRVDYPLLKKSLAILLLVFISFAFGERFASIPTIAIAGGTAMLLMGNRPPARILRRVDWSLLLFFSGLFIVTRGAEKGGLAGAMLQFFGPVLQMQGLEFILSLSAFSLILSNLVSNVPFVMMMLPVAQKAGGDLLWYTLAMSSTFAGNLTIVGSVANMIVVELSRRAKVEISFFEYFKVGSAVTLLTILTGSVILSIY